MVTAIAVIIVVTKFVIEEAIAELLMATIEGSSVGAAVAYEAIVPEFVAT